MKKILIVGCGPAGLYFSKHLIQRKSDAYISIIDKMGISGGLLNRGVAPDHQEIKSSLKGLIESCNQSKIKIFNNTEIKNVEQVKELTKDFSSIVFAWGCQSIQNLTIPGSDLIPKVTGIELMEYFNDHSYNRTLNNTISNLKNVENIIIVGNGNVAIDIARLLTYQPDSNIYLKNKNLSEFVKNNKIKNIKIIARRNCIEAACSIIELRELQVKSRFKIEAFNIPNELNLIYEQKCQIDFKTNIKNRPIYKKYKFFENISTNNVGGDDFEKIQFIFESTPFKVISENNNNYFLFQSNSFKNSINENCNIQHFGKTDLIIESIGAGLSQLQKDVKLLNYDYLYDIGWAKTKGKGGLAQTYFTCDEVIEEITKKWSKLKSFPNNLFLE